MASETHGAEALSACVDSYGSAVGMPQLCGEWMGNQVFWLVITLLAIYLILAKIALPRIASVLAERSGTISGDIHAAEELKQQAKEAEAAYEKALADARAQAQSIAQKARDDIKAQLDDELIRADAQIATKTAESEKQINAMRASALENVEAVAKDTTAALVAALGGTADEAAIASAVTNRMKG